MSSSTSLLTPPSRTRLVTIIAHVDHGKTTLADNLIESNGIISERLAGTVRYMDSLEEEQRRGITMRASAIGLKFAHASGPKKKRLPSEELVIHLVDSPGHVDFSQEVTTSLLACDGALLVVDAVEGMCARTHNLLREAHAHELVPVLVVNKIDRLCTDLCLSPTEAYVRLRGLVESVNAAAAAMVISARGGEGKEESRRSGADAAAVAAAAARAPAESRNGEPDDDGDADAEVAEDDRWNFDPSAGNVVFASALYGWGFTIPALARSLYQSNALSHKPKVLRRYLFGDYKCDGGGGGGGRVTKWKSSNDAGPMFAEFALRPIWEVYEGVSTASASLGMSSELFADGRSSSASSYGNGTVQLQKRPEKGGTGAESKIRADTPGMDKVLSALRTGNVVSSGPSPCPSTAEEMQAVLNRTGASQEDAVLRALLRRYRPLSVAVLDAVCERCPSPRDASRSIRTRALALRRPPPPPRIDVDDGGEFRTIDDAVRECDPSGDAPTVAHVCKFMATDRSYVTDPALPSEAAAAVDGSDGDSGMIMGLVRVLSGVLRSGDVEYFVFGPRHAGDDDVGTPVPKRSIRAYLLMGSSFVHVDSVPAGHICAVYGLEDLQLKTLTLCDRRAGMPLRGFDRGVRPLVKVNVEPVVASDTGALERGLVKLSLADAAVEVTATSKGERLLACRGEIHLEQSILDLEKIYCGKEIKLRISEPIVEFGESTTWFENETSDFEQFFDADAPVQRQATVPPYCDEEGLAWAKRGRTRSILSGRGAAIGIRVVPLLPSVYECLKQGNIAKENDEEDIVQLGKALGCNADDNGVTAKKVFDALSAAVCALDGNGNALLETNGVLCGDCVKAVITENGEVHVPQKKTKSNGKDTEGKTNDDTEDDFSRDADGQGLARSACGRGEFELIQQRIRQGTVAVGTAPQSTLALSDNDDVADKAALEIWRSEMRGSAVAGFQLAMRSGPLCEEPVRGVAVVLESVEIALRQHRSKESPRVAVAMDASAAAGEDDLTTSDHCSAKPISGGMVVAALRSGIRCALLTRPARLVEGHLRLTLHSSLAGLGPLYAVLSKRRGKVLMDSMVDGTDLLLITASLPQAESFHLAPELLNKSSGEVTAPELVFSHWEVLDEDPFWIPTSLEEREDYGEIVLSGDISTGLDNNALKYIRMVRERKGLVVDSSKIVIAAEKQRTLARKK